MGYGKYYKDSGNKAFHGPIIGRKRCEYCNTSQVISVDDGKEKLLDLSVMSYCETIYINSFI